MGNSAKKILGLLLMMTSVFLLLGGLYLETGGVLNAVLSGCGILLLIIGLLFYKLTGDSES